MRLASFPAHEKPLEKTTNYRGEKRAKFTEANEAKELGTMPTCPSSELQPAESISFDLVGEAQKVQNCQKAYRDARLGYLKLIAPAKVNLFLSIGERRSDGLHEVRSILHAITLHDVLYVRTLSKQDLSGLRIRLRTFACEGLEPLELPAEKNIVFRAIRDLARCVDRCEDEEVEVYLEKHIPVQAGLGGGSSDAAAALVAAAYLWGIPQNDPRLDQVARNLGSDVPFFLRGGCARFGEAGNVYDTSLNPLGHSLVLIKPDEGVSTSEAYRMFDHNAVFVPSSLVTRALGASDASDVPLFNNLASASEHLVPKLRSIRMWALQQKGVSDALLCGSGSTTFAVCDNLNTACRISARARRDGLWSRVTSFAAIRAARVSAL